MRNERVVLKKSRAQKALRDFVVIKLYTTTKDKAFNAKVKKIRQRFGAAANPWYVFLTPDGQPVTTLGGLIDMETFLQRLERTQTESERLARVG